MGKLVAVLAVLFAALLGWLLGLASEIRFSLVGHPDVAFANFWYIAAAVLVGVAFCAWMPIRMGRR